MWEIQSHSRESGFISGRLPDDLGGFTCMYLSSMHVLYRSRSQPNNWHIVQWVVLLISFLEQLEHS